MTVTMNGHAPIGADVLSREEGIALSACEERIERGLSTFVDVGLALAEVRESRLYRSTYDTFENYCRERWGFNDRRASQFIEAASVVPKILGTGLPAPTVESQAHALAKVPEDSREDVWREVNETPGKVTAEKIRDAADARKPDLAPTILTALADVGRAGLDLKALAVATSWPAEKDLLRALDKLTKSGEVVVIATWANGKPRKWASAELLADLTPDVERVLGDRIPGGRTAWQIAFVIAGRGAPGPEVAALAVRVADVLERLAENGRAVGWDAEGGMRWSLPDHPDTETPEPVAVPSTAPTGSGPTSPEPEPPAKATLTLDPDAEQKRAAVQRDARALLSRGVDLIAPASRREDHFQAWIKQLGGDDDELAALKARAVAAIAVLNRIIEEAGR